MFIFEDGSYNVREEYVVYDMGSFIADVGGYRGLLLGHSLLSMYYNIIRLIVESNILRIR